MSTSPAQETIELAAARAAPPGGRTPPGVAGSRRPLVRRADRRHHAGIRLHPVAALAASAEGGVWNPPTRALIDKAVRSILARQLPDGGFNIYAKGPSEISASVKAYFALKLAGVRVDDPRMARLRARILELGGIQAANSYVKINLSLFDLYPRQYCPSIPPEVMFAAGQFLYQMSAWTRAIVVSLAIVHSSNPRRPVPAGFNLDELAYKPGVSPHSSPSEGFFSWRNFFLASIVS
jgi:squalene-hopene/tetraprenyl-beta-curcumene cyclase